MSEEKARFLFSSLSRNEMGDFYRSFKRKEKSTTTALIFYFSFILILTQILPIQEGNQKNFLFLDVFIRGFFTRK